MGVPLRRAFTAVASVGIAIAYSAAVPAGVGETDQRAFQRIHEMMRAGKNYYAAFRDTFLEAGIRVSQSRSFRQPALFWIWELLPTSALYGLYVVVVVIATSVLFIWLADRPLAVLPVTLYLLFAARPIDSFGATPEDAFLLPEIWVLPLVAGSFLAWRRQRWWLAAGLAVGAVLIRELAILLPLGGLIDAHYNKRPRKPWIAAIAVSVVLYGIHVVVASGYALTDGNEAPLIHTADMPWSMLAMMDNAVPGPLIFGLLLWGVGVWRCANRGELLFFGPYLALALTGILVDRPYWGMMFVAFTILWTGEAFLDRVVELWQRRRRRGSYEAAVAPPPSP